MNPPSTPLPNWHRDGLLLRSIAIVLLTLAACTISAQTQPDSSALSPLPRAHAHNDYEHTRPLLDALDHGFCSVEADIHLVDGELLVAHDLHQTRPGITLKSLYLQPLRERVQLSNGRVYPHGPDFILLIDIKSDADATYPVLRDQLRDYADILTRFEPGRITTNAVTAILSGNRPDRLLRAEAVRYAAYDGRIHDLDANPPLDFMPLVSDNWRSVFQWRGQGPLPEADQKRLQHLVARAHEQQRRIRFWAVPDQPAAWQILHDAGVDLINTDNLSGLREFLLSLDPL